jgi:23S rRNA (uracil1939-C5)-methyltransferase
LLASDRIRAHQEGLRRDADFMASLATHNKVTVRETQADGVVHWVGATPGQGRPWLTERTAIGDLKVPRGGFFQVNPEVASVLLARVSAEIELQRPGEVLDLYTGVGIFALAAVRAGVSRVTGIDYDGPAIEAARINARQLSGGAAVRFVAGPVSGRIASALRDCRADDACVIVDPPRMGMDKSVRDQLVRHRPAMVVYVSCAPDTLARDLAHLTAAGYRVKRATLMDMFPRTSHFESLTVLCRDRILTQEELP